MEKNKLQLIGYASGLGGVDLRCGDGPRVMQKKLGDTYLWADMIAAPAAVNQPLEKVVRDLCEQLATRVSKLTRAHIPLCVLGGDHSAAMGTWSGVYDALHQKGDLGLIWFDAHMDSHTPQTTQSGRIHGMPLASLLGHGDPSFTSILHAAPKFKPENVCLIGVRSFEAGEAELLRRLNVKIYFMDEIEKRGFLNVWQEAVTHVSRTTIGYGISLDLDGIDPADAPGVDVPEPSGVRAADLLDALAMVASDPRLIMTEIVEFDPARDRDGLTEKIIISILALNCVR